jgi:hypothetical protein
MSFMHSLHSILPISLSLTSLLQYSRHLSGGARILVQTTDILLALLPCQLQEYVKPYISHYGTNSSRAQVERAFKMFLTGIKINVSQFSHDHIETLVSDYMENTAKLTEQHWKKILEHCGADVEKEPAASTPSMDECCRILYTPSSPMRESDD